MFILKLAVTVCANGFVITDETDDEGVPFPIAGFGDGQLPQALDYLRKNIEQDIAERAEAVEAWEAQKAAQALGNVVAEPGFKASPAPAEAEPSLTAIDWDAASSQFVGKDGDYFIIRPVKTDREIVDEVNALALTLLKSRGRGAPDDFEFHKVLPGRGQERELEAWAIAVSCYEQITGRNVGDATHALRKAEREEEAMRRNMTISGVLTPAEAYGTAPEPVA